MLSWCTAFIELARLLPSSPLLALLPHPAYYALASPKIISPTLSFVKPNLLLSVLRYPFLLLNFSTSNILPLVCSSTTNSALTTSSPK